MAEGGKQGQDDVKILLRLRVFSSQDRCPRRDASRRANHSADGDDQGDVPPCTPSTLTR
jgi:hypothetical protein